MSWTWAAFMPHPPIVVPQVGRGREKEAAVTLAGLAELKKRLAARPQQGRPEALLVLSPHQPYAKGALFINTAETLRGGLGRFGAPEVAFELNSSPLMETLIRHLSADGLPVATGREADLGPDHGTLVPLSFLAEAFGPPPEVIIANPVGLSPAEALRLGRILAGWDGGGRAWALLASGDLSHRLKPDGPYGFNPEGPVFDRDVMAAFKNNSPEALLAAWPAGRLEEAGECGFRSALALMGLAGEAAEALAYEGPFGVGYGLAWWDGPKRENGGPA